MKQSEIDELKKLTSQLNKHDSEVVQRLDTLTEELHRMSFQIHNDLQVLMGVIYVEEKHAMNGRTVESLHHIKDTISDISGRYNMPIGVIKTTKRRILVVEDEPSIAEYLNLVLEELGYSVVGRACRADTAVILAVEQKPDLVLMDISLEGETSGIDAACKIMEKTDIPVIFATGRTDVELVEASKKAKPEGYLIKPFSADQIYATIELALSRRKKEGEITPRR